ncbi:hypothetical protein ACERHZ_00600 [Lactobacillus acidophilus]|uniref:hypothetical protein n=1 Tax=Lactobacillus acidophilus TaxID=1579 RepID=UPI003A7977FC
MWTVLIINLLIAIALAYFGLKERQEAFSWFTAGSVFIVFGLILLISAIPVFNDFNASSLLMFIGGILLIVGIIALIIGFATKAARIVSLRDIAIAMEIAAVCVIYLIHNLDLSFINLFVPELSVIIGFLLFVFSRKKN